MGVGIIVKGRDRTVRMQKDIINQVSKNVDKGNKGTSQRQKQRILDFKQISKEGRLKVSTER